MEKTELLRIFFPLKVEDVVLGWVLDGDSELPLGVSIDHLGSHSKASSS